MKKKTPARPNARERMAVITAAIAWWRCKGPISFSLDEHLKNPTINTTSSWEKDLAIAVAKLLEADPRLRRRS